MTMSHQALQLKPAHVNRFKGVLKCLASVNSAKNLCQNATLFLLKLKAAIIRVNVPSTFSRNGFPETSFKVLVCELKSAFIG